MLIFVTCLLVIVRFPSKYGVYQLLTIECLPMAKYWNQNYSMIEGLMPSATIKRLWIKYIE